MGSSRVVAPPDWPKRNWSWTRGCEPAVKGEREGDSGERRKSGGGDDCELERDSEQFGCTPCKDGDSVSGEPPSVEDRRSPIFRPLFGSYRFGWSGVPRTVFSTRV